MGSQREDHFVNLEQRRDHDVSVHTAHTSRSQSRNASHISHGEDTNALQLEIDHLKRKLCHERRKRTPSVSNSSIDDEEDHSYKHKSRTPPSKSFSYDEDVQHEHKSRNSSSRGLRMTWWVEHLTKSPNHPSHAKSRKGDFLGDSLSQHSPCTMVERILWSMWATLTKEWLCILRMKPWCARCSPPI